MCDYVMNKSKLLRIQALLFSFSSLGTNWHDLRPLQPCDALAARLLPRIHRGGVRDRENGRAVRAVRSGSGGAATVSSFPEEPALSSIQ